MKNKKHFNLYYIFQKDREEHMLSPPAARWLWTKIREVVIKDRE